MIRMNPSSVLDLRTELAALMGSEADPDTVKAVAHWVQWDDNRPHWKAGADLWEAYLETLDLWDIARTKCHPVTNA